MTRVGRAGARAARTRPHQVGFRLTARGEGNTGATQQQLTGNGTPNYGKLGVEEQLLWRLYTAGKTVKTVCLEEPENGLHPLLLAERFEILNKFARHEEGLPGMQLLVATHASEFLRPVHAHPAALWGEIRLTVFTTDGGTSIRPLRDYREAANLHVDSGSDQPYCVVNSVRIQG